MSNRKFRKKPVVIEAMQFTGSFPSCDAICAWSGINFPVDLTINGLGVREMFIETLEGKMRVDQKDWVIRGVQGEFYPCKPDIFEATYEAVE